MIIIDKKSICIDVGGTKLLGVLFQGDKIISKVKKKTKAHMGTDIIIDKIISIIEEIIDANNISLSDIKAISAGIAAVVDEDEGMVVNSPNMPLNNIKIKDILEGKFKVPFYMANDVNTGILGEWKYGSGVGLKNLVGIFVGTGIGGGLVLNNSLYSGHKYAAGEIGHMILNTEGPLCNCGQKGCLEAYASKTAMLREIKLAIGRGRSTILKQLMENDFNVLKSKVLKKGIEENDSLTKEIVDKAIYYLAAGTGSIINIFNPEAVIFGGGVIEAIEQYVLPKLKSYLLNFTMPNVLKGTAILTSKLGDDSIVYGARALIDLKSIKL